MRINIGVILSIMAACSISNFLFLSYYLKTSTNGNNNFTNFDLLVEINWSYDLTVLEC